MKMIQQYALKRDITLDIPVDAEVLSVDVPPGDIRVVLTVLASPGRRKERRRFVWFTRRDIIPDRGLKFIGICGFKPVYVFEVLSTEGIAAAGLPASSPNDTAIESGRLESEPEGARATPHNGDGINWLSQLLQAADEKIGDGCAEQGYIETRRRIEACVRACEGISTELLESAVPGFVNDQLDIAKRC